MEQGCLDDALQPLFDQLMEFVVLEPKYQAKLSLPTSIKEVTTEVRDGTAHVLRCFNVWYDMPSEVLFVAINLLDRFLTKIKPQPKHMACIAIAAFHWSAEIVCRDKPGSPRVPEGKEVAAVSQCRCTAGDVTRMQGVMKTKLADQDGSTPITAFHFLRTFNMIFRSSNVAEYYERMVDAEEMQMIKKMEIVACDSVAANFRACNAALVVLGIQMGTGLAKKSFEPGLKKIQMVNNMMDQIRSRCQIAKGDFIDCYKVIKKILTQYNAESQMPHRQRLVWKLSERTLQCLRPTENLIKTLPTIREHTLSCLDNTDCEESWD